MYVKHKKRSGPVFNLKEHLSLLFVMFDYSMSDEQ